MNRKELADAVGYNHKTMERLIQQFAVVMPPVKKSGNRNENNYTEEHVALFCRIKDWHEKPPCMPYKVVLDQLINEREDKRRGNAPAIASGEEPNRALVPLQAPVESLALAKLSEIIQELRLENGGLKARLANYEAGFATARRAFVKAERRLKAA